MVSPVAHPPETLEGWYALHQIYTSERRETDQDDTVAEAARSLSESFATTGEGWSAAVRIIGSVADLMVVHFRPTLDAIGEVQRAVASRAAEADLRLGYSFLSVTEAGLYHLTAKLAGDPAALAEKAAAERENEHVRRRLYPPRPADMPYVCFYPMSKRRDAGQNWYTLSLEERSRLMQAHGLTGRRYAGRVQQIITGAIGFENWEWGVTLFARDPLDIKKLVTDMRFDEVSAKYADFGDFFMGKLLET
jgi:hydrogen peroxide-dependent heme synthase